MNNITIDPRIKDFLDKLFPSGLIEIRPFHDSKRRGIDLSNRGWYTPAELLDLYLPSILRSCRIKLSGVFFGVLPRSEDGKTKKKGTAEFVLPGRACWADIDVKDLEGGWKEADELIESLLVPPSCVVKSGGGYHIYYFLDTGTKPEKIEQFNQFLIPLVKADSSAWDMARVLRLPCSMHLKDPKDPKQVIFSSYLGTVYSFDLLSEKFGFSIHEHGSISFAKKKKKKGENLTTKGKVKNEEVTEPDFLSPAFRVLMGKNPRLQDLYDGRGKQKGNVTKSGYDFSFCWLALKLGATVEETEKALAARAFEGGGDRWKDVRYLQNTVRNAQTSLEDWREQQKELKTIENPDKNIRLERLQKSLSSVVRILQEDKAWVGKIRYNAFKSRIEIGKDRIIDADLTKIRLFLERYYFPASAEMVGAAVEYVARENEYHPVQAWIEKLRWDGKPRLKTWIHTYLGVEPVCDLASGQADKSYDRLIEEIAMISLIGSVARIMAPGAEVHQSVLFSGPQGVGKTSVIKALAIRPEWYSDTALDMRGGGSRDTYTKLRGVWLYELPEMASIFRTRDMESVKAFLTSNRDSYREAYARFSVEVPRQNTWWLTSNRDSNLFTDSENRRFLPVAVKGVLERCGHWMVDLDGIRKDAPQLWAEAFANWKAGVSWVLSRESQVRLRELNKKHTIDDPWASSIEIYHKEVKAKNYSIEDLLFNGLNIPTDKQNKAMVMRLSEALSSLTWEKKRVWVRVSKNKKRRCSRWVPNNDSDR